MSERPEIIMEWATDLNALIEVPPLKKQKRGWDFGEVMPSAWRNALDFVAINWMKHYAEHASTFHTLDGPLHAPVTAPFEIGQTCYIDEETHGLPGTVELDVALGQEANSGITVSPRSVVVVSHEDGASAGDPLTVSVMNRCGELIAVLPSEAKAGEIDVATDGQIIVVAARDTLEAFHAESLALLWRVPLTARDSFAHRRIALSNSAVFVIEAANVVKGFDRADGSEVFDWSASQFSTLLDIATDGQTLFVLEDTGTPVIANAIDIATAAQVWIRSLFATNPAQRGRICIDQHTVYAVARNDDGVAQIEARSKFDGSARWSRIPTYFDGSSDSEMQSIFRLVTDGRGLYGCDGVRIVRLNPATGHATGVWKHPEANVLDIAADGLSLWVALSHGPAADVAKFRLGHPLRLWRRVDVTSQTFVPLHQELIPA